MKNICSKKGCNKIGDIKIRSETVYCFKCNRFNRMMGDAQKKNKYKPSWKELEELFPQNMICPVCDKQMIWHTKLGCLGDVISLQHNCNGNIILICQSCNVAHRNSHLGDEYFNIPKDHKYCPYCKNILLISKFCKCNRNRDKHNAICKQCDNKVYYKNKKTGEK